jgi:hypothetical protein
VKHRRYDGIAVQVVSGDLATDVEAVAKVGPVDVDGVLDHHIPDVIGISRAEIEDRAMPLRGRVRASPIRRGCQVCACNRAEVVKALHGSSDHLLGYHAPAGIGLCLDEVEMKEAAVDILEFQGLGFNGNDTRHGTSPRADRSDGVLVVSRQLCCWLCCSTGRRKIGMERRDARSWQMILGIDLSERGIGTWNISDLTIYPTSYPQRDGNECLFQHVSGLRMQGDLHDARPG